jgi:diacylglycerol kinase
MVRWDRIRKYMLTEKQSLMQSFWNAFRGIKHELRERNFVIQIMIGIAVIALSLGLDVPEGDKMILLILIAFVLVAEIINSACERMLNLITRDHNAEVARIKDMLAGAVLIYSATAFVIGVWIFGNALR